ncbi:MAG: DUF4286 family protein [Lewinellaceae bacterium]|nr:DUF4286 family protein [Lewinellaceae bacterium]
MLLYNVTVTIDLNASEDWLRWMRDTHIPDVMSTGMFISYRLSRLIGHEHNDSEIYSVQYLIKDQAHLMRYQEEFAPVLQKQTRERYDGKFAVFRTIMEVVDHNEK